MHVRAKVRMVHASTLREPGEIFPWLGPGEPPEGLCEKAGGKTGKNEARPGATYAESMKATRADQAGDRK